MGITIHVHERSNMIKLPHSDSEGSGLMGREMEVSSGMVNSIMFSRQEATKVRKVSDPRNIWPKCGSDSLNTRQWFQNAAGTDQSTSHLQCLWGSVALKCRWK